VTENHTNHQLTIINNHQLKKETSDLFDACRTIYETKKGRPVTDDKTFSQMINNFKAHGVTADDYAAAIDAMDADPRYNGSESTSYERWAIGYAEKRKSPLGRRQAYSEGRGNGKRKSGAGQDLEKYRALYAEQVKQAKQAN
jgi:hypothetical protein